MIIPVVVVDSILKAVISCTVPERESTTCAVDSGFFIVHYTTVLHTIASAPDCGSVEAKRFSLTQGGRLHEGSAPSDKRPCRLIVNRGNYGIVGSINKAAELYTGVSPIQDSPKADSRTLTNHHPYRSPCIV